MFKDIAKGVAALAQGLKLLYQPGIRVYVIIPLTINLVFFSALIWWGYNEFYSTIDWLMSYVPGFLSFLEWFIWTFVGVLTILSVSLIFTPITNIIAAPFNALMSEKIEIMLTGSSPSSETSFLQMAIDSISSQLGKLVYILFWGSGLFLISFIPFLNFLSPFFWVIFGSWLLSLEYLDYPMGNHELSFSQQKKLLRKRRGLSLGFGGSVMIMTSIPIVNLFAMPIAVAGATVLWVEQLKSKKQPVT